MQLPLSIESSSILMSWNFECIAVVRFQLHPLMSQHVTPGLEDSILFSMLLINNVLLHCSLVTMLCKRWNNDWHSFYYCWNSILAWYLTFLHLRQYPKMQEYLLASRCWEVDKDALQRQLSPTEHSKHFNAWLEMTKVKVIRAQIRYNFMFRMLRNNCFVFESYQRERRYIKGLQ